MTLLYVLFLIIHVDNGVAIDHYTFQDKVECELAAEQLKLTHKTLGNYNKVEAVCVATSTLEAKP